MPGEREKEPGMSFLEKFLRGFKGITFCALMIFSCTLGAVFVLFPVFPLIYINRKFFRWLSDHILALWESFPVALMHILCGADIRIFGDEIDPEESSLLIMNHRTRLDWLWLWAALYPGALARHKIILKKDLKFIPGSGWAMQFAGFLFLDRKWETDKELFRTAVEYVRHDDRKVNMLLFPEGTDLNPKSRGRSDAFAVTNTRPKLEHCLYPRVRGFTFLYDVMRANKVMDCVYDITVVYPDDIIQNEKDLLTRGPPKTIYFHVKRHAAAEFPESQADLEAWLSNCWTEKEQTLRKFYEKKTFKAGDEGRRLNAIPMLYVSGISWLCAVAFWLWLLATFLIADLFFVVAMVVFTYITFYLNGVDRVELVRFKLETPK